VHTAKTLHFSELMARLDGHDVEASSLMPFDRSDRFGIVVNEPYGALGAGLLITLAIAAYFDAGLDRRTRNLYPEIYLFHSGGPWGSHAAFDFWPERKEIFTGGSPADVLSAINHCGITYLAIPEKVEDPSVVHHYREPEIARDQLKRCFSYAVNGSIDGANLVLSTASPAVIWNYIGTLQPESYLDDMDAALASTPFLQGDSAEAIDYRRIITALRRRWNEVSRGDAAYVAALARARAATEQSTLTESYRTLDVPSALLRL
jgi:hypothetical protein